MQRPLDRADHFLKEDIAKEEPAIYQSFPFSAQLRAELKTFLAGSWSR